MVVAPLDSNFELVDSGCLDARFVSGPGAHCFLLKDRIQSITASQFYALTGCS